MPEQPDTAAIRARFGSTPALVYTAILNLCDALDAARVLVVTLTAELAAQEDRTTAIIGRYHADRARWCEVAELHNAEFEAAQAKLDAVRGWLTYAERHYGPSIGTELRAALQWAENDAGNERTGN